MKTIREMIKSHPREPICDVDKLAAAIAQINTCAQTCTSCADACLGENDVAPMIGCIQTDLDCADICRATGSVLSRQSNPSREILRSLLAACASACRACAIECDRHANMHLHCRLCAAACLSCEKECRNLLEVIR